MEKKRWNLLMSSVVAFGLFLGGAQCPLLDNGDDDDDYQKVDEITITDLAKAYCSWIDQCELKNYPSDDVCRKWVRFHFECQQEQASVDQDAAKACMDWMAEDTTVCNEDEFPTSCDDAVKEKGRSETQGAKEGESCDQDYCADGLFCDYSDQEGVCAVCQKRAVAGEDCDEESWDSYLPCDYEFFCDTATYKCVKLKAEGEDCQDDEECANDYCKEGQCFEGHDLNEGCDDYSEFCKEPYVCKEDTCSSAGGIEDACQSDGDCGFTLLCVSGSCQEMDYSCGDAVAGESCRYKDCVASAYCKFEEGSEVCVERAAEGADCYGGECQEGLVCFYYDYTGTCTKYAKVDESCAEAYCEDGAYCDWNSQTCVPSLANGEVCDGDYYYCASYYCDPETDKCADMPVCTMP